MKPRINMHFPLFALAFSDYLVAFGFSAARRAVRVFNAASTLRPVRSCLMGVSIVLIIGEAIGGAIGGIIIGRNLNGSSFGNPVNSIIGLVGGVTVGYLLHNTLPDLANAITKGSLGSILDSIIGAFIGGAILITACALVKDNVPGVRDDQPRR
jgi:uncharacterized membrane protein YeaQ/YmgE (transglycosylase-associated protein family)